MPKLCTNSPSFTLFFWIACLLILSNKHSNANGERVSSSSQLVKSSEDASVNLDNENIRLASQMLAKYNKAASFKAAGTGPTSHRRTTSSTGKRGLRGEQRSTSFEQDTNIRFEEIGSGPEGGRLVHFFEDANDEPRQLSARRERSLKAPKGTKSKSTKSSKKTKGPKMAKSPKTPEPLNTDTPTEGPTVVLPAPRAKCTNLVAEDSSWTNWHRDITNFTPVFRPATDEELRQIIVNSKNHGCTIRMMGAASSQDGMVMQRKEEDTVVISLASHSTQIDGWQDSIDPVASTFRIGAGKSWFDVSSLIRPHGFVLKTRTSGAYFSVGGVVANMVHGSGRSAGFLHDNVVSMLVLTSDSEIHEVGVEDLKYWRSSAGELGMILAVEMEMHSEAIPFVSGINPATGEPVFDLSKGGMAMERERTSFPPAANPDEFALLLAQVTEKVFQTNALYDSAQFFFNFYTNTLAEYRSNFSGPRFSGEGGDYGDAEKSGAYGDATKGLSELFADVAFTGVAYDEINTDILCQAFCIPPSGPLGDGSPCIPIPSTVLPGANLCNVPVEVSAAISASTMDVLDGYWDAGSSGPNDGYFIMDSVSSFDSLIAFVPARAFAIAFSTWYDVNGKVVSNQLPNINFAPNSNLEFRFINPKETAILNPIPTIEEIKSEFDQKYNLLFGGVDSAFDLLLPPLPPGVPDGLLTIELTNIKGVYTDDVSKYMLAMQQAWSSMPTNPYLPYGENIVKTCDAANGIFPCQNPPMAGSQCCNPPIPAILTHLGKGWGYAFDPNTTPTTGKMQPFMDQESISNLFRTGSKQNSISDFNNKRSQLNADVFSGGAMMRWLDATSPYSEFEARKLDGQMCGSLDFIADPNKECINDACVDSVCV